MSEELQEQNEQTSDDNTRETLKKQLELELGIPLNPRKTKQYIRKFKGETIILNHYPINRICSLKISGKEIEEFILMEEHGLIHLPQILRGTVLVEYCYCLPESEYTPLLDLMVEYETSTDKLKDATSISEGKVSVSFDKSTTKGAIIQGMIADLKKRHSYSVRVI